MGQRNKKKSRTVNNIADLREHAIGVLNDLRDGEIETSDALVASRLYDNVCDITRLEIDYNRSINKEGAIGFLSGDKTPESVVTDGDILMLQQKFKPE